jgi:hypothetical protein
MTEFHRYQFKISIERSELKPTLKNIGVIHPKCLIIRIISNQEYLEFSTTYSISNQILKDLELALMGNKYRLRKKSRVDYNESTIDQLYQIMLLG